MPPRLHACPACLGNYRGGAILHFLWMFPPAWWIRSRPERARSVGGLFEPVRNALDLGLGEGPRLDVFEQRRDLLRVDDRDACGCRALDKPPGSRHDGAYGHLLAGGAAEPFRQPLRSFFARATMRSSVACGENSTARCRSAWPLDAAGPRRRRPRSGLQREHAFLAHHHMIDGEPLRRHVVIDAVAFRGQKTQRPRDRDRPS